MPSSASFAAKVMRDGFLELDSVYGVGNPSKLGFQVLERALKVNLGLLGLASWVDAKGEA